MKDTTLYLHIGLPKTGTTFLQEEVFPRLPSIKYLNKPKSGILHSQVHPMYGIMDRFFSRSAIIWEKRGDLLFTEVLEISSKEDGAQVPVLISDEGIGHKSGKPFLLRLHLENFAEKCSEWGLHPVKIICTFRRQDEWIASHYAQLSDRKVNASQEQFEAYVREWLDPAVRRYSDGMRLDYKTLRDQLVGVVGTENVLMLPYELFCEDPSDYLRRLFVFLGFRQTDEVMAHVNDLAAVARHQHYNRRSEQDGTWKIRSRPVLDAKVIRLRPTRLFQYLGLPTAMPIPWPESDRGASIRVTAALKQEILDVFAEGNRALAANIGLDLAHYGYYEELPQAGLNRCDSDRAIES